MKAVILCAGDGERLKPLTEKTPKPLIEINGKPLLSYILFSLPDEISEVHIVIKEKHNNFFKDYLESLKKKKNIKLFYQDENKKGTFFALMTVKNYFKNEKKFLVLNGDDIFLKTDMENLIKLPPPVYGLSYRKLNSQYKTCDLDKLNQKIISFRKQKKSELNIEVPTFSGSLVLNNEVFSYKPFIYENGEAGLPHTLFQNCKNVSYLILTKWFQINNIEDLKLVQKALSS
jgi:NDP-sugar pyrophosphorylase family protein